MLERGWRGSGSMAEMGFNLLNEPRILSARRAVRQVMPRLAAARRLGLPVGLLRRPPPSGAPLVHDVQAALAPVYRQRWYGDRGLPGRAQQGVTPFLSSRSANLRAETWFDGSRSTSFSCASTALSRSPFLTYQSAMIWYSLLASIISP
mgnify:CR=1 FL=1